LFAAFLGLACAAGGPGAPAPGTGQVSGRVRLVPREGVTPVRPGSASYGDRRLRDVEFVDYSRPGFAVVYTEADPPPAGELAFAIRESRVGTRLEPEHGAVGAGGRVIVRNEAAGAHVLSYPAADLVRRLEPGGQVEIPVPAAGEQELFLIDRPAEAVVFAAPGPFAVVSSSGDFALRDLAPGRRRLRAWHPRFPTATADVELAPGAAVRVDIDLGLGRREGGDAD
jgi:hypothetical protein